MRIRGGLAKGFLIALAISLIPAPAISAQKPTSGSKCKVQKQKIDYLDKTYTCIKSGKKLVWNKGVVVTKPTPAPTPKIESITYSAPSQPSANIETCKIVEKNKNRENPPTSLLPTGFPRHTIAQKTGTVKWALIPIDFSDLPGDADFKSRIDEQMKLTSEWFETVSEGKFKVEWVVADKWMRLPGITSDYAIDLSRNLNNAANGPKLFTNAMNAADPFFNFTGIQTVNFILPKGQNFIQESSQGFPWDAAVKNLVTNEGSISSFSIPGKIFDTNPRVYWSYWAHEFGHSMAMPHVGNSRDPNPFLGLDLMANQEGESRELSGWLRFVAGWLDDEKVYCQELKTLNSTEITLIPISDSGNGIKMVVVPISETKVLLIESRRENKFSCQMPSKRNGVLVYEYNPTLMHADDFLKPITPYGRADERSPNCLVVPYPNPILYKGEKISIDGITIEVIESMNYDKIRINKIG
jgi:M6 family metalloprotease-like protein